MSDETLPPETPETPATDPAGEAAPTDGAAPTSDAAPESAPAEPAPADAAPADPAPAESVPSDTAPAAEPAAPVAAEPTAETAAAPAAEEPAPPAAPSEPSQTSLAAPRGLAYAVDIVFCIDVTGSMTPIIDTVKTNALRFYDDVQTNLTEKGKNVDQLRVRVVAFRDFLADGAAAMQESPFYELPGEQSQFSEFVNSLIAQGGGDAPESGLEAVSLAINSPWTSTGDRRRQVIVVWTDTPAQPLGAAPAPADLAGRIPANFSDLTDLWENEQGVMGSSSKRLIMFAPDGPGWTDISGVWENVVHHPSQAGGGLSDVDYGTIIDSIGNSV